MFSYSFQTLVCFVAVLFATAGCGDSGYKPGGVSDAAVAKQTLAKALDTWKAGAGSETLVSSEPKVYVGDEDWTSGSSLKDYSFLGDGELHGNNVRFQVGLELGSKSGSTLQKTVRYIVATDPVLSVTRDDRGVESE